MALRYNIVKNIPYLSGSSRIVIHYRNNYKSTYSKGNQWRFLVNPRRLHSVPPPNHNRYHKKDGSAQTRTQLQH